MIKDDLVQNKQWKKEVSAGGVVYTDARSVSRLERRDKKDPPSPRLRRTSDGKIFVLLIKPSGTTNNQEKKWTFPKGLIDDHDESSVEETALREVKEESGVEAKIIEKLGSIKYTYKWEGQNIFKIVTFFLMEYVSGDPKDHDFEVAEAKWVPIEEVLDTLSHKTDKEIFEKAVKKLT